MKKMVSFLLAIMLFGTMVIPAFSASASDQGIQIQPFYVAITSITATISRSGTQATCSTAVDSSGAKTNVKIILQRSTNGGASYSDYSTLLDSNYTTRNIVTSKTASGLTASYKYRTKVVVTVYNASGKQIDQGTAYSPGK